MSESNKGPTDHQTLMRGEMLPVKVFDGVKDVEETIKVRQLPYARFNDGTFVRCIGKGMPAMVALYTGKDEEWVERLHPDSIDRIMELGRQLNFPIFELCNKHRKHSAEWVATVVGALQTEVVHLVEPFLNALQSLESQSVDSPPISTGKS